MLKPFLFQIELVSSWISENVLHSVIRNPLPPAFLLDNRTHSTMPHTFMVRPIVWSTSYFSITCPECGNCNMHWNMEHFQHTMWLIASHSCNRGSMQSTTGCILFLCCLHTPTFLMLFCSNKCALKHLFWINSSFCKCRLFSWRIKICYQQHGIYQVHFLLKLSNLWYYLPSSVSEHNYEPVPSTSLAQKECSKKHHNVILPSPLPLECGYFQRFLPKSIALAYPIWSSQFQHSYITTYSTDDLVRHIYQILLSFSPMLRCFISTMILYL